MTTTLKAKQKKLINLYIKKQKITDKNNIIVDNQNKTEEQITDLRIQDKYSKALETKLYNLTVKEGDFLEQIETIEKDIKNVARAIKRQLNK